MVSCARLMVIFFHEFGGKCCGMEFSYEGCWINRLFEYGFLGFLSPFGKVYEWCIYNMLRFESF